MKDFKLVHAFRVRVEFVEPIKKIVKDYVSERIKTDV